MGEGNTMKITEEMVDNACSVLFSQPSKLDKMDVETALKRALGGQQIYTVDQIFKAWKKSGLDVLGGNWDDFMKNLTNESMEKSNG
jgi:hypothetical protein